MTAWKSIYLFMLHSGSKPACSSCCMVLSFLRLLLRLERLNLIESEIAIRRNKKVLLSGHQIKEPRMSVVVKSLLDSRTKGFFESDMGILPRISEALHKYGRFYCFENWHNSSTFPSYSR